MIANWVRMPAVAGALIIGSLWPAQAARADGGVMDVPCSSGALAGLLAPVDQAVELALASHCTYVLTAPLRIDDGLVVLDGDHSTLERSYAPGTPQFTIIKVTGDDGVLVTNNVNFRNAKTAIENDVDLYVNGGTFSGNGTAILNLTDASVTGAKFIKNSGSAIRTGGQIFITD